MVSSTHIALHSFNFIVIIPYLSWSDCANLCFVGRVEVISNKTFPIAVQRDCTPLSMRETVAGNSFTFVSVVPYYSWGGGSNLLCIGGVEVVVDPVPVAIERHSPWHLFGVQETLNALGLVAVLSHLASSCCSNLGNICGVEMIRDGWFPVSIKWSQF